MPSHLNDESLGGMLLDDDVDVDARFVAVREGQLPFAVGVLGPLLKRDLVLARLFRDRQHNRDVNVSCGLGTEGRRLGREALGLTRQTQLAILPFHHASVVDPPCLGNLGASLGLSTIGVVDVFDETHPISQVKWLLNLRERDAEKNKYAKGH